LAIIITIDVLLVSLLKIIIYFVKDPQKLLQNSKKLIRNPTRYIPPMPLSKLLSIKSTKELYYGANHVDVSAVSKLE
jgi:hypothetical protein